jgi:hypothetical protein
METAEPAVLIKLGQWTPLEDPLPRLGHGFRAGMSEQELYDSTRAWWVISRGRALRCRYFVCVYAGVTRGVWEFDHDSWTSRTTPMPNRQTQRRWSFEGRQVPPEVRDAFIGEFGRAIPSRRDGRPVFGSGSVIAYWPD